MAPTIQGVRPRTWAPTTLPLDVQKVYGPGRHRLRRPPAPRPVRCPRLRRRAGEALLGALLFGRVVLLDWRVLGGPS